MRVLFTADLHINLRQKNVPKEWALNRYNNMFEQLFKMVYDHDCDQIIIGGDIFDKLPSLEELSLFINYMKATPVTTIIYDGNHEATKKGQTFLSFLKPMMPAGAKIIDEIWGCQEYSILPYRELHSWKGDSGRLLFTHVRGEIPPHVKPEVNLDLFNNFELVLAGDLHSHTNSQRNIVYPGSPVTVTFHRSNVKTGAIVIDTDNLEWKWVEFALPQLIRKTVEKEEDIIPGTFDHIIYELKGTAMELGSVNTSDLLEKKLVENNAEAVLDLKDLTIEEELVLYCTDVLGLEYQEIEELIGIFNDNAKEVELE